MLKSESERIAFVRTVAPLVWSLVVTTLATWGLQVDSLIADNIGLDLEFTNRLITVVIGVALWLLARFAPQLLERLIMWIPVTGYAYSRPDDSLIVASGRIAGGAGVLDISPDALGRADSFVDTYIARRPSPVALRAAAAQLLEAADEQP